MAEKKCPDCPPVGAPAWVMTFGDMMTLLLTFFVLLLSFSSMRTAEFNRAMGALKGALGVLPREQAIVNPISVPIPQLNNLQESEIAESLVKLEDIVSDMQLDEVVKLEVSDQGLKVTIDNPLLFEIGKADIRPVMFPILSAVAEMARGWPNQMRIEGHTDNQIISTPEFPSNWELSAKRAINVARYFVEDSGLDPTRILPVGRSMFIPMVSNDTAENRARNRRIELYIDYKADLTPPDRVFANPVPQAPDAQ
jgi:chemotaxis protein MotB